MPMAVQFNDTSTRSPTSWNWSFGDGNFSSLQNPVHVYALNGTFSVSLTAANDGGSTTMTKTGYITVTVVPPVANFTADVRSGPLPLAVQFTDTSTGSLATWNWSFGDGTISTIKNPLYTYTCPGNYTVALNVTNPGGYNQSVRTGFITTWIKGDLNRNLRVDINDVTRVAFMAVQLIPLDPEADFNEDHVVDVSDASMIAWYYVGKIPKL
jgi:PKD repeat protein